MLSSKSRVQANVPVGGGSGGSTTYTLGGGVGTGVVYNSGAAGYGSVSVSIDPDHVEMGSMLIFSHEAKMKMSCVNDDICIELFERVNGVMTKAVLEPESSLAPIDQLRISNLLLLLQAGGDAKPIAYLRKHNLERHFRFSCP